jgi:superfamily I DNA/RNA helicase
MERLLGASHERKCPVFAVMKNPAVTTTFQARTRESIEGFVELIERTHRCLLGKAGALFPLTPTLSLGEREHRPQRAEYSEHSGLSPEQPTALPLPKGEGRGEGEQNVRLSERPANSLQTWADRFLEEIGYFAELRRSEKNHETAENRVRNLKDLIATLDGSGSATVPPFDRLQSFLEQITLDNDREDEKEEEAGDAVTLITMHSCKGLEFPNVYIVGLEDGLLPHSRSKAEGTLDEERRLFYVAVTRAMHTLTISHCGGRKKYGTLMPCHPSQFLKELPPELVEHADEKAKQPITPESGKGRFDVLRASLD